MPKCCTGQQRKKVTRTPQPGYYLSGHDFFTFQCLAFTRSLFQSMLVTTPCVTGARPQNRQLMAYKEANPHLFVCINARPQALRLM